MNDLKVQIEQIIESLSSDKKSPLTIFAKKKITFQIIIIFL